ncbi:MAG: adenosylcobinamide-GDP ribazoletransferase, partial [Desulfuromonadaceae bacterium]
LAAALATAAAASWFLLGLTGMLPLAALCLLTFAGRMFFQRKLGGLTGDTIGCLNELNEILALVVMSALPQIRF